ncbi:GGDEF domain-containing protein [Sphingomonas sp. TZW2008]|uniref:GGDEF domain-containing protein n=1 Tax=Sphingomonas sp. TZW2008 TaxID=1917973 RepID=UPI000A26A88B|nr:GGDEF domain-containing protein [Sphingomonas sp. TZW2008]
MFRATHDWARLRADDRPDPPVTAPRRPAGRPLAFVLLGLAVFAASMLGLASRHAFSVSFWPANAVLVGLALRDRRLFSLPGYAAAAIGFVAADLVFGRPLTLALFFAATNVVSALVAALLLARLSAADLSLRRSHAVLRILACLLPGSIAAGLCGALLVRIEFGGSMIQALQTWPASELVNYMVVLPALLTVRPGWIARARLHSVADLCPALLLAASCAAAVLFDGPGSIVFPVPALLWCALTYLVPVTAVMTTAFGTFYLTMIGLGLIDIGQDMAVPHMVVSVRVTVAFLVLIPLTIGSAVAVRDDLMRQLRHAADHDGLTGLLNRRAFEIDLQARLAAARDGRTGLAILWLDVDRFKAINDRFGHLAGDAVLRGFATTLRGCCPPDAVVGRLGGEEFGLVIDVEDARAAEDAAERLRAAIADRPAIWGGAPIAATASIGACYLPAGRRAAPDLLHRLDQALYRAKDGGRDRIEWCVASDRPNAAPSPAAAMPLTCAA